jgi:tRNA-specific 2-thiouridylase
MGFDALATGHHARRTVDADGAPELRRGADAAKDQSYVLAVLGPDQRAGTVLPVGEMTKADVRAHATRLGLRTATKAESMDVCFITRGGRGEFLDARAPARVGAIVDTAGHVLGAHDGIARFTVGQRRGLGVAAGARRYVIDVDADAATVTIGTRDDLLRDAVAVHDWSFVAGVAPTPGSTLTAQLRAHGAPVPAELDGDVVRFERPQPRVAPGQVVALYDGDVLVGGGIAA